MEIKKGAKVYIDVIFYIFKKLDQLYYDYYKDEKDVGYFFDTNLQVREELRPQPAPNAWYNDRLKKTIGKFHVIHFEIKKTSNKSRTKQDLAYIIGRKYNKAIIKEVDFYELESDTNPDDLCISIGYKNFYDYVKSELNEENIEQSYLNYLKLQLDEFGEKTEKKQKTSLDDKVPIYHWWCYLADVPNENQETRGILCGKLGMYEGGEVLLILERANGKVDKYQGDFEQIHGTVLKIKLTNNESIITKNEKPEFLFHPREHDFMGKERLRILYIAGAYIGLNADGAVVMGQTILQCPKNIEKLRYKTLDELDFKQAHEELAYTTKFQLSGRRSIINSPYETNRGGSIETIRKFRKLSDYIGVYEAYNVTTDSDLGLRLRKSLFKINSDLMVDCIIKKGDLTNQWNGRISTFNSDNGLMTLTIFTTESKENNHLYYWKIMLDFSKNEEIVEASYIFSNDTGYSEINIGRMLFIKKKDNVFEKSETSFIEPYSEDYFKLDEKYDLYKIFSKNEIESIRSLNSLTAHGSQLVENLQEELTGTYYSYYYHPLSKNVSYNVIRIFENGFVELFTKPSPHQKIEIYRGEIRQMLNLANRFSLFLVGGPYRRSLYFTLRLSDETLIYLHGLYLFVRTTKTRPFAARSLFVKIDDRVLKKAEIISAINDENTLKPSSRYPINDIKEKVDNFFFNENILEGYGSDEFYNNNFDDTKEIDIDLYKDYSLDVFNSGCFIALHDINKINYEQVRKKIIKAHELGFSNIERIKTELQNQESLGKYENVKALFCDIYGFDEDTLSFSNSKK